MVFLFFWVDGLVDGLPFNFDLTFATVFLMEPDEEASIVGSLSVTFDSLSLSKPEVIIMLVIVIMGQ